MDQRGKVANLARGQLNRENEYPRSRLRIWSREMSRPASACSFSMPRLNLVLTHGIPPDFRGSVHLFCYTAIRHRVSPEFIGSRNFVPIAFTAESPPAQGQ